jgi:hypothetical protein
VRPLKHRDKQIEAGPSAIYRHGANSTYQKVTTQATSCMGHISRVKNGKKVKRPNGP